MFFNPAAFAAPNFDPDNPNVVYGNAGRGILETPGIFNVDLSLLKSAAVEAEFRRAGQPVETRLG